MTRSEKLLALCEAATQIEHYNHKWVVDRFGAKGAGVKSFHADICSFVPTPIAEHVAACNPAEVKRMVEVMLQMREALKEYTNVCRSYNDPRDFTPKVIDEGFHAREAIAAFDAWQKGGE